MEHDSDKKKDETISIHIDKKEVKSPNPTTGHALYQLGGIGAGYDLYREVKGKGEDELIANDSTVVHLEHGDHFFSTKQNLNPGADARR